MKTTVKASIVTVLDLIETRRHKTGFYKNLKLPELNSGNEVTVRLN